jgi:hypothetical protein
VNWFYLIGLRNDGLRRELTKTGCLSKPCIWITDIKLMSKLPVVFSLIFDGNLSIWSGRTQVPELTLVICGCKPAELLAITLRHFLLLLF